MDSQLNTDETQKEEKIYNYVADRQNSAISIPISALRFSGACGRCDWLILAIGRDDRL